MMNALNSLRWQLRSLMIYHRERSKPSLPLTMKGREELAHDWAYYYLSHLESISGENLSPRLTAVFASRFNTASIGNDLPTLELPKKGGAIEVVGRNGRLSVCEGTGAVSGEEEILAVDLWDYKRRHKRAELPRSLMIDELGYWTNGRYYPAHEEVVTKEAI